MSWRASPPPSWTLHETRSRSPRATWAFCASIEEAFAKSPNISIDYAVMEKTDAAVMLPIDVGWSDVGSWTSLWEIGPRDAQNNYVRGDAVLEDSTGLYVHSERSLVSTIGVKDLIIVDTPDALLVADRARAQDVSKVVARLRQLNRKEQEQHLRNYRPWGYFETLSIGPRFQVKLLHVKPGGKLSMQRHHHRSEHWVVVQGTAKVTVGETETLVRENESVYIIATQWHRLENPGKVPARAHRGANRHVSRRRRHHPQRGCLSPQPGRDGIAGQCLVSPGRVAVGVAGSGCTTPPAVSQAFRWCSKRR